MTILRFLKANAMQVAGACQVVVGLTLSFAPSLTTAQAVRLASLPTGLGTLLAGIVITARNGKG